MGFETIVFVSGGVGLKFYLYDEVIGADDGVRVE